VAFDGDGQITSALDYVTGDSYGTAYQLTGHGESELPDNVLSRISKANVIMASAQLNIARSGIPADCDLLISYAPTTDLATDELAAIREFMAGGGKVILLMEYVDLGNFNSLMGEYGLELQPGFVYDTTRYYEQFYTNCGYYCIYPLLASKSPVTGSLTSSAMLQYPRGMLAVTPARTGVTITPFMASSESAVLADGTTEKAGQYLFGAVAEETVTGSDGKSATAKLTVISATSLIFDGITENYPSLSNLDIFANTVSGSFDAQGISIASRSLEYTANTVSNYGFWSILFVAVIPLLILLGGFVLWIRRRKS
jgi:ABC-2 type transport system permease protein